LENPSEWKCPDCGIVIPAKRLAELNDERAKLKISLPVRTVPCGNRVYHGKRYHIPGVAAKAYHLTAKARRYLRDLESPQFKLLRD